MDELTMNRRGMLRGAGVVGAVALAGVAGAAPASASENGASPTGSWLFTHVNDADKNDSAMGVASFAQGGVLISHDIFPAGPPGTGTWARHGDVGFQGTFWTGEPGPGGPGSPGLAVRVQVRGRVHKDKISGTYRLSGFSDPAADPSFKATGTFTGHRIEA